MLPKQPRLRLDLELYDRLREQVRYGAMAGDANVAGLDRTLKFITRNSAVRVAMIPSKI